MGMTTTRSMAQVTEITANHCTCFEIALEIAARYSVPCKRGSFLFAGVRDYIHVVDLAKGHIAALKKLKEDCGCKV